MGKIASAITSLDCVLVNLATEVAPAVEDVSRGNLVQSVGRLVPAKTGPPAILSQENVLAHPATSDHHALSPVQRVVMD